MFHGEDRTKIVVTVLSIDGSTHGRVRFYIASNAYAVDKHNLCSLHISCALSVKILSVRRPCNVYRHVTAPYKLSFYYYFIIT